MTRRYVAHEEAGPLKVAGQPEVSSANWSALPYNGARPISFQSDMDFRRAIDLTIDSPSRAGSCVDPREIRPDSPPVSCTRTSWSKSYGSSSEPLSPATPRSPLAVPVTPTADAFAWPERRKSDSEDNGGGLGLKTNGLKTNLEVWLDQRGLGKYSQAIVSLGARRVSDLSYLDHDDLVEIGMDDDERADIRVVVG